ncbi:hypothetical protein BDV26DRAFT_179866 [Aspergillus bertholletiae]|uniref:Uncharacterized protein n=1 Tax=Aspergillus bertholletiae TaxID=1226010 RepID=A0A5N7BB07_9EURO|nr:hypothetical protein BDV26DRAFT_179866 [Aspergillus bertholletiae]
MTRHCRPVNLGRIKHGICSERQIHFNASPFKCFRRVAGVNGLCCLRNKRTYFHAPPDSLHHGPYIYAHTTIISIL